MPNEWRACCNKHKWNGPWRQWNAQLRADFTEHFKQHHFKKQIRKLLKRAMRNIHTH